MRAGPRSSGRPAPRDGCRDPRHAAAAPRPRADEVAPGVRRSSSYSVSRTRSCENRYRPGAPATSSSRPSRAASSRPRSSEDSSSSAIEPSSSPSNSGPTMAPTDRSARVSDSSRSSRRPIVARTPGGTATWADDARASCSSRPSADSRRTASLAYRGLPFVPAHQGAHELLLGPVPRSPRSAA